MTRDSSAVVRAAVLSVANGSMNPLKRVTLSHIWNNVPSGEAQWVSIMNVIGNCTPGVAYETGSMAVTIVQCPIDGMLLYDGDISDDLYRIMLNSYVVSWLEV